METKPLKQFSSSLLVAALFALPAQSYAQAEHLAAQIVDQHAEHIFYNSGAMGMALVVIDNNQVVNRSFGETRAGNNVRPRQDSLIRIASITKLMTSEIMVKLADEGKLKLTDPLKKYAPKGAKVPAYNAKQPITLLSLASHTSGLPREQPGGPQKRPVFTWPTKSDRWQWLKIGKVTVPPGVRAAYSNLAYDLLADALSKAAAKPYTTLLREKITEPLGMRNTTLTPTAEQCSRLMVGVGSSACLSTIAAAGSGGIYSTPEDMQRWMQQFLTSQKSSPKASAKREQKMYYQRHKLVSLKGMDVPGQADALGLGWVYMAPKNGLPGIIQKTGGGGGFITYMAMIPEKNIGVFVVVTRTQLTKFINMSDGVNQLVANLASNSR
ncbi:D-alanyl-D-alanine-carboxypeptidase/endopeptidase AmpH [Yersinia ruckeri]|uniref:D-alanyl-D-alanine- carboxypeptidase/endopeptidase AmpH n=1 Tax=Yersinia ruckeri TaxID=29486 RepID=UPI000BDE763B|nr:D-alanyl-D-alanine-carboxypeptidase/endopeptidase AmpH [Yersinia ruckeri]MCK8539881.1 D-alanyl-D-alanine-carboxypeptidase/endopeptidase AmpH [Yersinia ruckeri]MCK8572467.1 D-alanyl-D-alanine-carboxypeptidase/endopeptidase AmpH [Yersinia ruckeri]MCK8575365.1 D-alanyl-D-alanine-carboxypeptidase/endopeptidase AmpH [Yersinia ruckeri]MCK8579216.1 D-alanyl-D-alanine-carboxypeptidase/endopeptidase AmpH [Yersinia ruckeri]MCK8582716.1 D-alanyl-D-alanine-carboxypeptidase/endopeptidase AmpH [Yersinia 